MDIGNIANLGIGGLGLAIGLMALGILIWYMKNNPHEKQPKQLTEPMPIDLKRIEDMKTSIDDCWHRLDTETKDCAAKHSKIDTFMGSTETSIKAMQADIKWMRENWPPH